MKEIKLTQGKVALVDDEDFDYLNKWKWYARKDRNTFYAVHKTGYVDGVQAEVKMHQYIMKPTEGLEVDHIDHNGLNNQKSNLRNCTHAQNGMNRKNHGKSMYKGVSVVKNKYMASFHVKKKSLYLGTFKTEIEAARAYDRASKKYFGEFANLNFK